MDIKAAISPIRFHLNQLNLHRLAGLRFRSVDSNRAPQMAPRSSCHSARHRPTPRYSLSRCFNNSETRQNKTIKKKSGQLSADFIRPLGGARACPPPIQWQFSSFPSFQLLFFSLSLSLSQSSAYPALSFTRSFIPTSIPSRRSFLLVSERKRSRQHRQRRQRHKIPEILKILGILKLQSSPKAVGIRHWNGADIHRWSQSGSI